MNVDGEVPPRGVPVCPECGAAEARPSKSSYPLDRDKTAGGEASFWRCSNCGVRFLGPKAHTRGGKRPSRSGPKGARSALDRNIRLARAFRRWIFPVLVILTTILAVMYILERRDPRQEQIVLPDG